MSKKALIVVAAVIDDGDGNILIQQRTSGPFAGYWEFPGGKVEHDESLWVALARELKEELDLDAQSGAPLLQSRHAYPDRVIDLNVWRVNAWSGTVSPQEGQSVDWCHRDALASANLLPADAPIVTALLLPDYFAVTPNLQDIASTSARKQFVSALQHVVESRAIEILTLGQTASTDADYLRLAEQVVSVLGSSCDVLLHGCPETRLSHINKTGAAGFHFGNSDLNAITHRESEWKWLAASCNTHEELQLAARSGVDFAVLGHVGATNSEGHQPLLGWERFNSMVSDVPLPVFAMGGMTLADVTIAQQHGGQGIAAIDEFWPKT